MQLVLPLINMNKEIKKVSMNRTEHTEFIGKYNVLIKFACFTFALPNTFSSVLNVNTPRITAFLE